MAMETNNLKDAADRLRLRAVRMIAPHGFGYLGQALSSAEQFAVLFSEYYRPDVDDLVVSPGHYIIAAFAGGVDAGLIDEDLLATYGHDDSTLEAIGTERSPVVDLVCGSLGTGLSGGVGFALSNALSGRDARTFVVISDGELEEGQLWEAAMFASHNRLGSVVVLLDANDSQVDGPVSSITTIEPIAQKFESFGWAAFDIDGHDVDAVSTALSNAIEDPRPAVIIARTSTVTGLSVLPEDADGHFIKLPPALAERAIDELESRLA